MSEFAWREYLPVHPAADLFPLMSEAELKELAEDIKANGLRAPITLWVPAGGGGKPVLLDGRNRLDALARLGLLYETGKTGGSISLKTWTGTKWTEMSGDILRGQATVGDPYAVAISLNLHRRHLIPEQKRDLIAKLLKAKPEASNNSIAKQTMSDDKTVASVRRDLESNSEIPNKTDRVEPSGRKARGRKPATERTRATKQVATKVETQVETDDPAISAEQRKAAHAAAEAKAEPTETEPAEIRRCVADLLGRNPLMAQFVRKALVEYSKEVIQRQDELGLVQNLWTGCAEEVLATFAAEAAE